MQGGDSVEAEAQPNNGLEGIDEPPLPTLAWENEIKIQENEVDMQEEGVTRENWEIAEKRRDKAEFTGYYTGES